MEFFVTSPFYLAIPSLVRVCHELDFCILGRAVTFLDRL
jgi:hypothetical protein